MKRYKTFRLMALLLTVLLCMGQFAGIASAAEDVALSPENFPDAAFRTYAATFDTDSSGSLSPTEISNAKKLSVVNKNISDLTGIEYFKSMTKLSCQNNQLTTLNLSKNIQLNDLDCSHNQISQLNIDQNAKLKKLSCGYNLLTELDLSKNPLLEELHCPSNQLKQLNVVVCPNLSVLRCGTNQLETLTADQNLNLTSVACNDNKLKTLVLGSPELSDLSVFQNELTQLQLSTDAPLDYLNCAKNQLATLDVSAYADLSELYCYTNGMTLLTLGTLPKLQTLHCQENALTALDVSGCPELVRLAAGLNQLTELNVSKNAKLEIFYCDQNQLEALALAGNPSLTHLYCGQNRIASLDVTANQKLVYLECFDNCLTSLELGSLPALTYLWCSNNPLGTLDVSKCPVLCELYCKDNGLTELSLEGCPQLAWLNCSDNQLTELNLTVQAAVLKGLSCSNNALTRLDVSALKQLQCLFCNQNNLTSVDVTETLVTDEENHGFSENIYYITVHEDRTFDLDTLPAGFDVSRASDWEGGKAEGTILTVDEEATQVHYTYDCGHDITETFTLVVEEIPTIHIPVTLVVEGENAPAQDFELVVSQLTGGDSLEGIVVTSGEIIKTEGANTYTQELTVTVPTMDLVPMITGGIVLQQKSGAAEGWTYSDAVYLVCNGEICPLTTTKNEDGTISYNRTDNILETAVFTNTYTAPVPPSKYTLHYESNGGAQFEDEGYFDGTIVSLDKTPERIGYTFTGWYAEKGTKTPITHIVMDGDKTVYAGWTFLGPADIGEDGTHVAYVSGYSDGTIRPENNITRAEVAQMLFRLLTPEHRAELETTEIPFSDVEADEWYTEAICSMAKGSYLCGYPDGSFKPNESITRAEFVTILVRFIGTANATNSFPDVPTTHWAYREISTAEMAGWIAGYTDGSFCPESNITRAEAMTIINRMLNRGVDADSKISNFKQWPDVKDTDWFYYEIIEATNAHKFIGSRPSEDWVDPVK